MTINKRNIIIQSIGLLAFCIMAMSSASSQQATSRDIDWRGAAVGAAAGYNGYTVIGTAYSEEAARKLAASKGYEAYIWDTVNNVVYGK